MASQGGLALGFVAIVGAYLGRAVRARARVLTLGGRTDVLFRVETPSSLGGWSYEVVDTKLSRETKGGTILQLSLYSDLLGNAQGLPFRAGFAAMALGSLSVCRYRTLGRVLASYPKTFSADVKYVASMFLMMKRVVIEV
jgi:hypothetical protein